MRQLLSIVAAVLLVAGVVRAQELISAGAAPVNGAAISPSSVTTTGDVSVGGDITDPSVNGININPGPGQAITSSTRLWGAAASVDSWLGGLSVPTNKALYLNGVTSTVGFTYDGTNISSFGATVNLSATKVNTGANWGTATLAAGTQTATVTSGARCVCTDQTAAAAVRCSVSGTTLTLVGTGTDVITYFCDK